MLDLDNLPSAWDAQVDDRIGIIAEALGKLEIAKQLPHLKDVLDDYLNPDTDTTKVQFHRGLLQTFKDSETDNTYQNLLSKYSDDERSRLEKFVEGEDPEKVSKGFVMGPSMGARDEMNALRGSERVHVTGAGPIHVDGLSSNELREKDNLLHKFVHQLADFFHIHEDKDAVDVRDLVERS